MSISSNNKPTIKINTRVYKVKKSEGYIIPSKGMICSWKVLDKKCKIVPCFCINDRIIISPRKNKKIIDIAELRNYIRNIDVPEEPHEIELDSFENLFYNYQLYGIQFYQTLTNKQLFDSLFTRDIKQIQISFGPNGPDEVEIEETYWDRRGTDNGKLE
jgi:tRNA-binding EMAP/Myf-like protein